MLESLLKLSETLGYCNETPGELCSKPGLRFEPPDLEVSMKLKLIKLFYYYYYYYYYCAHLISTCDSYEKYVCFGNLSLE